MIQLVYLLYEDALNFALRDDKINRCCKLERVNQFYSALSCNIDAGMCYCFPTPCSGHQCHVEHTGMSLQFTILYA